MFLCVGEVCAQESMHSQSVVKQEYLNPAYNSFKDYSSVNFLSRNQWSGVGSSPKLYGANCYVPLQISRMGVGLTLLKEEIGLRDITMINASFTNNIRIKERSFLSFGYGLGMNFTAYDQDRIIAMDNSYLGSDIDWTSFDPAIKLGLFYTDPHIFAGVSCNTVIGGVSGDRWYLPGFDFVAGSMHRLSPSVFFRPDLVVKYYRSEQYNVTETVVNKDYVPPVCDLSVSFLLYERVWLSTSRRFNLAHTFSLDVLVTANLQVGYSFELGIGDGLNQFNSNGISFSYRINKGNALGGFQKEVRYNYGGQFKYLYR